MRVNINQLIKFCGTRPDSYRDLQKHNPTLTPHQGVAGSRQLIKPPGRSVSGSWTIYFLIEDNWILITH